MDLKKVSSNVRLGKNVKIHDFVNLYGCSIGDETRIGAFVEIQKNASVGKSCKISSHTFICEGVNIGNRVFVGHNVTFINDKYPKATNLDGSVQDERDWTVILTVVEDDVSIGSSTTILCGVRIGKGAIVGAGSVITHDVPPGEVWIGNPARFLRKA